MRLPSADEQDAKRQAMTLWEQDRARLLMEQPFVAMLAMHLDLVPVVDDRLGTASTDGRRVFVHAPFLLSLSESERVFLLAHEVWHCAMSHFRRSTPGHHTLWNVAFDHEVNAMLASQDFTVPDDAVLFEDKIGWNAEQVFAWLMDQDDPDVDRGLLADVHPESESALAASDSEGQRPDGSVRPPSPGSGSSGDGPDGSEESDGAPEDGAGTAQHTPVIDPDYAPVAHAVDEGQWEEWVHAAGQQAARRQDLPARIEAWLSSLRRPLLPWKALLADFVTRSFGGQRRWLPPSRRHVHQGLYLPSRREDRLEITLAIDTSGSTHGWIDTFLDEVEHLMSSFGVYRLRIIQCDDRVQSDHVMTDASPERPSICFGMCTDFRPVFAHIADEPPAALVYLTDGYGEAPEVPPSYPVLWVLTPDGSPLPWGQVAWLPWVDEAGRPLAVPDP